MAFQQYLRSLEIDDPARCIVAVVNDDSMAPRIRMGDLIIINPKDQRLIEGRVYGLLQEDLLYLRTYFESPSRFECSAGIRLMPTQALVVGRVVYRSGSC